MAVGAGAFNVEPSALASVPGWSVEEGDVGFGADLLQATATPSTAAAV
jgi:hypothetical protein